MASAWPTVNVKVVSDKLTIVHAGREITVPESLRKQLGVATPHEKSWSDKRTLFVVKGEDNVERGYTLDTDALALLRKQQ